MKPGDELRIKEGEKYTYEDGREGFGKEYGEIGITLDKPRLVDLYGEPDPNAPEDHPDSKSQKIATFLCFETALKIYEVYDEAVTTPTITLKPIVDGRVIGEPVMMRMFAFAGDASDEEIVEGIKKNPYGTTSGLPSYSGGRDKSESAIAQKSDREIRARLAQQTYCQNVSRKNSPDTIEGVTGFAILTERYNQRVDLLTEETPSDAQGWRLDLKK